METTKFIELFAEALDIDATTLSVDTEFRTLGAWDSMTYLSVIAMMDDEYNVQIENAEFKTLKTIGDIIKYIENHQ